MSEGAVKGIGNFSEMPSFADTIMAETSERSSESGEIGLTPKELGGRDCEVEMTTGRVSR